MTNKEDRKPFEFTPGASVRTAVGEAVGAASVCWESMEGTGLFDEARAREIANKLMAHIESHSRNEPLVTAQKLLRSYGHNFLADALNEYRR